MLARSPLLSRRALLRGAGTLAGAAAFPRAGRAGAVSGSDRKFIFIFASGGWDPSLVLAEGLDNPALEAEAGAERGVTGGVTYADSEARPSVRAFFEAYHDRAAVINGVLLPTISHEVGYALAMTGLRSGLDPDWATILAAAQADRFAAPAMIVCGPSYPGALGSAVVRCGPAGQLHALLTGRVLGWSDTPLTTLGSSSQSLMDAYVSSRAADRVLRASNTRDAELASAYAAGLERSDALKRADTSLELTSGGSLVEAGQLAVDILAAGLSRCVVLAGPPSFSREWDTHNTNDVLQSALWEDLFAGLLAIHEALDATPGLVGRSLADETVVVVNSEMGRMPTHNAFDGRDHWPYTSMLVTGSGVAGDRVIGGHDERWGGLRVDLETGDISESGAVMTAGTVGAALLRLGDVDPGEWLDDAPLEGLLA